MEETRKFAAVDERQISVHKSLTAVYDALLEKGYNPINQMVGYLLSHDPTYITSHKNARAIILKLDRDEVLQLLLKSYLSKD